MSARAPALLALPLVVLLAFPVLAAPSAPVSAGGGDLRVEAAIQVAQLVLPHVKRWLSESDSGKDAKVRELASLPERQLVVGRKTFEVNTRHWDNSKLGKLEVRAKATCEAFYAVDLSRLRCDFQPGKKVLRVYWPEVKVLTVTPDLETEKVTVKGGLLRPAPLNPQTVTNLRDEVPAALKRVAGEAAREHLEEVQASARKELHRLLRELVREIDRDIEVKVD